MVPFVGRIFRAFTLFVAVLAFFATSPLHAAPFAAIVMDARSGEVLYEKNADSRLHPASLTKMMTLYITFQELSAGRLSLDTEVTVSKHAASQPPSRLGLKQGQKIKLRYLIRAAAIKSANDAATAIGEHIGGSEAGFAKRMTRTAKALGMRNSTFRNAHGLTTEGHLSSARDMNILGRHLFYDFPQYYSLFSRRTADAGIAQVRSTNSRFLDGYEGADGIKTGYTVAAGFNLTASAKRGDKRIIATVFGGASTAARNAKMVELMNIGFGRAGERVQEKKPQKPLTVVDEPLVASADIDTPDAQGGAGKVVRVSGAVSRSLRFKARPGSTNDPVAEAVIADVKIPDIPDPMAEAIAEGVESALAEATAAPPPPNTLEAQALAMVAPPSRPDPNEPPAVSVQEDTTEEPELAEDEAPQVASEAPMLASAAESAPPAPPGSLQAQAQALDGIAPGSEATPSLEAQALAVVEATNVARSLRPQARPERLLATAPVLEEAPKAPEVLLAEAAPAEAPPAPPAPVVEQVAPAPVAPEPAPVQMAMAAAASPAAPQLSAVETVSARATQVIDPEVEAAPTRRAPIFDSVEIADATPTIEEELRVVSKSTSGGRAWGVAVGAYSSHYEAERALLKTGLTESATLNQGLRKVTQSGGKYRAAFLGLTEDQADLACRRIRARGVDCTTTGPA